MWEVHLEHQPQQRLPRHDQRGMQRLRVVHTEQPVLLCAVAGTDHLRPQRECPRQLGCVVSGLPAQPLSDGPHMGSSHKQMCALPS